MSGGSGSARAQGAIKQTQMQFISLLLILITFTIGSFLAPKPPLETTHERITSPKLIGEMELSAPDENTRVVLDEQLLLAIAKVLQSHDIRAEIRLPVATDAVVHGEDPVPAMMGRGIEVLTWLQDEGVLPEAALVTVLPQPDGNHPFGDIRFFSDEVSG